MRNKTYILIALFSFSSIWAVAQKPANTFWHLEKYHPRKSSAIDFDKAAELSKTLMQQSVIVAVIDAGMDINHEDLKDQLWINQGEIPDNGIDDDKNGYVDDIYGWNFIGGKDGNVTHDNLEITRLFVLGNTPENREQFPNVDFDDLKQKFFAKSKEVEMYYNSYAPLGEGIMSLEEKHGNNITIEELENHKSTGRNEEMARTILLSTLKKGKGKISYKDLAQEMKDAIDYFESQHKYHYNPRFDGRELVGDDYTNPNERYYGNNELYAGKHSDHGTHVAGIIAANVANNIGAKGICETANIMTLRCVPDGDERDKDVANSIRYAADNGARIVNMSFGKAYSSHPEVVVEAIKYAISKDVLLVHAAGNESLDLDVSNNYPNNKKGEFSSHWLEVGAASWEKKPKMLATFSNYGKNNIDVFAPGVAIYSAMPENEYEALDGTSMAAPVVSGVAAYLLSYYPTLTGSQLKEIIVNSAQDIKGCQKIPGKRKKTKAGKISKTGKTVNLYHAMILADTYVK